MRGERRGSRRKAAAPFDSSMHAPSAIPAAIAGRAARDDSSGAVVSEMQRTMFDDNEATNGARRKWRLAETSAIGFAWRALAGAAGRARIGGIVRMVEKFGNLHV